MTDIHRYAAGMQAALPDILAMAERCVNIDSGSYLAGGVNAVIDIWARMAAGMGFAVERAPLPGFGDQMTARLPLGGNGPRVLVLGHADTVWPAGIAAEWPFKREGDRITGPGVGDMKTNVVMALHAIRMLLAAGTLPPKWWNGGRPRRGRRLLFERDWYHRPCRFCAGKGCFSCGRARRAGGAA